MYEIGMMWTETFERVAEIEREELQNNTAMSKDVSKLANAIMRMTVLLGLEPNGATAEIQEEDHRNVVVVAIFGFGFACLR